MYFQKKCDAICDAYDEGLIDVFVMESMKSEQKLTGRINGKSKDKIFVNIYTGVVNYHDNYKVNFHVNRQTFQLQHQALNLIQDQNLFPYLINNPLYHNVVDEVPVQTMIPLR